MFAYGSFTFVVSLSCFIHKIVRACICGLFVCFKNLGPATNRKSDDMVALGDSTDYFKNIYNSAKHKTACQRKTNQFWSSNVESLKGKDQDCLKSAWQYKKPGNSLRSSVYYRHLCIMYKTHRCTTAKTYNQSNETVALNKKNRCCCFIHYMLYSLTNLT